MTRVVVIGGGGREHALVRALRRGGGARETVAVPGNPGIAQEARCVPALPSLADAALAPGKGVIVAGDGAAAAAAVDELWKPGTRLLVEERLEGREVSIIALCDGETVLPLPPARDHKRLLDGDQGPNTGGMGAVCPP